MTYVYVFFCDHCRTCVEVNASNLNARVSAYCVGQNPPDRLGHEPVVGDHEKTRMRMIGAKSL